MGRAPCCDKANVKKGPWSPDEDMKLKSYIEQYGIGGNWIALPHKIGLKRCGKSCRLRWLNYLRPNIKHGGFSEEEEIIICNLYVTIGSRWSIIAAQLPGRTDNDIKNYWNTKLKKKLIDKQQKEFQQVYRGQQEMFTTMKNLRQQNKQNNRYVFGETSVDDTFMRQDQTTMFTWPLIHHDQHQHHHNQQHHNDQVQSLTKSFGDQEEIKPSMIIKNMVKIENQESKNVDPFDHFSFSQLLFDPNYNNRLAYGGGSEFFNTNIDYQYQRRQQQQEQEFLHQWFGDIESETNLFLKNLNPYENVEIATPSMTTETMKSTSRDQSSISWEEIKLSCLL